MSVRDDISVKIHYLDQHNLLTDDETPPMEFDHLAADTFTLSFGTVTLFLTEKQARRFVSEMSQAVDEGLRRHQERKRQETTDAIEMAQEAADQIDAAGELDDDAGAP